MSLIVTRSNSRFIDQQFTADTPLFLFDGTWTASSGTGSVTYRTGVHGTTAVTFNKTGTGNANVDKTSGISFQIDAADGGQDWLSIYVANYIPDNADYVRVILGTDGAFGTSIAKAFFAPNKGTGWQVLRQASDWANWSGSPSYPFTAAAVRIQFQGNKLGETFSLDALWSPVFTANDSFVVFTFDDGYESAATIAQAVLETYNYPGTAFVIEDETVGSPLTSSQLKFLVSKGWVIGVHHLTNLTTLTEEQVATEIAGCINYIASNAGVVATSMAWPQSTLDEDAFNGVAGSALYCGRTGPWAAGYGLTPHGTKTISRYVCAADTLNQGTVETIKAQIDTAVANKMSLVIFLHDVVASGAAGTQTNTADLNEVVAYASANGMIGLTFTEFCNRVMPF